MRLINAEDYIKIKAVFDHNGGITIAEIQDLIGCTRVFGEGYKTLLNSHDIMKGIFSNVDAVGMSQTLAKRNQRLMDDRRISNKTWREQTRALIALEAMNEALLEKFDQVDFNVRRVKANNIKIVGGNQAIIQLADTHFNELVDLENNQYDFDVASKRMQKFAAEIKAQLKPYGVQKVVLAMTGDLINSDRRLDEKAAMATNRMSAALIGTQLIQHFIVDLMNEFHQMDVFSVTGNESRSFEMGWTNLVAQDNYDHLMFNMLKSLFKRKKNVRFFDGHPLEQVISVNGKKVLLIHGTTFGQQPETKVTKIRSKYAAKGVCLDYMIYGHIHSTLIGDFHARSASLVGGNTYSDLALELESKASQNLYLIKEDGDIFATKIDLQEYSDYDGYDIQSDLAEYNAKSADKMHKTYQVIEVARM